jgi:ubiquinone biosynthesis protein UbiJ
MFDPQAADDFKVSYEVRLGEDRFRVVVAEGHLEVVRGGAERPDATIEAGPATLEALAYDGRQLDEALRSGDLKIEGDGSAVECFLQRIAMRLTRAACSLGYHT